MGLHHEGGRRPRGLAAVAFISAQRSGSEPKMEKLNRDKDLNATP